MVNRIVVGIERYNARIAKNEKGASQADLDKLYKTLDVSVAETTAFFETNARAFAEQKLSLEESQLVYQIIGRWDDATLAERITITQVIKELLKTRLNA